MTELYALVDYENVQPTLQELEKLAPGFAKIWLFYGPHQAKPAKQLEAADSRVNLVPRSGRGPNALDFHLTFYLGYEAARHPHAQLVVVANDKGYDPMIAHAGLLGFAATRVGFKATRPTAAKKAAAAKTPAPAKKAAAKKTPAKKAPAKKTPAAKAVASTVPPKIAPAKKAPAKKIPTKMAPAQTSTPSKKAAPAKVAAASEPKELTRIKQGLAKMGDKRPHKLKSLLRHLESLLGKASTPAAVDALLEKLAQEGVVRVAGDKVSYG